MSLEEKNNTNLREPVPFDRRIDLTPIPFDFNQLPCDLPGFTFEQTTQAIAQLRRQNPGSVLDNVDTSNVEELKTGWELIGNRDGLPVNYRDHIWLLVMFTKAEQHLSKIPGLTQFCKDIVTHLNAIPETSEIYAANGVLNRENDQEGWVTINIGYAAKCLALGEEGEKCLAATFAHEARHIYWFLWQHSTESERQLLLERYNLYPELTKATAAIVNTHKNDASLEYFQEEDAQLFRQRLLKEIGINDPIWTESYAEAYWGRYHCPGIKPPIRKC